ncbi:MAG: ThiF family adenylyltransferase [Candidatus Heimdallarchaeota archaeon]|nr:MAG: ThiF family adenylyltransferase [Candidatus Heimdallarchaeota archaeon]
MTRDLPSSSKYDRQERLALWDQHIIEKSTILIAGVGGTGSELAKNLALLGIGSLILVDDDTVEFSNLNRQMLFREEDVGQKKAKIAKKRIKEQFNPDIMIKEYADKLQNIPQKIFQEVDIIAGCVDNFLARQYLNAMAIELKIPLIDSATDGYFGQIQYIKTSKTACLACETPPPPDETRVLTAPCTLVGVPRVREHCAWKALYEFNAKYEREPVETSPEDIVELTKLANTCAKKHNFGDFKKKELLQLILFHVPSLITVNAVTSGIQSQEIVKALFLEKKEFLKETVTLNNLIEAHRFRIPHFTVYSALTGTLNTFDLVPDPNCLVCGQSNTVKHVERTITVDRELLFKSVIDIIRQEYKKEYIGFRGNFLLPEDESVQKIISDGDRITLSSIADDEEIRLEIKFRD